MTWNFILDVKAKEKDITKGDAKQRKSLLGELWQNAIVLKAGHILHNILRAK